MKNTEYHSIRKDFQKAGLDPLTCPSNPVILLDEWLNDAISAEWPEPTAMVLSTVGEGNKPSSRVVLLKGLDQEGLRFFTNYLSKKADDLEVNPQASLLFFWAGLERQVRVEGRVEKTSDQESDTYFFSRPKDSQINAVISPQSKAIPDRNYLLEKRKSVIQELQSGRPNLERPSYWGGYLLTPDKFEFWQGRPGRLHDRILYTREDTVWNLNLLAP